jgi:hypothetical protein
LGREEEDSVTNNLSAIADKSAPVANRRPCIAAYLRAIAALCAEVAERPELLSDFVAVIRLAPATIAQLGRERKRIAA